MDYDEIYCEICGHPQCVGECNEPYNQDICDYIIDFDQIEDDDFDDFLEGFSYYNPDEDSPY